MALASRLARLAVLLQGRGQARLLRLVGGREGALLDLDRRVELAAAEVDARELSVPTIVTPRSA